MFKNLAVVALLLAFVCVMAIGFFVYVTGRFHLALAIAAGILLMFAFVLLRPTIRRHLALASVVLFAGFATTGCVTAAVAKMTPEQQVALIAQLRASGCSGNLTLDIHGSTAAGVSPGSANAGFNFSGGCDPNKAAPPPTAAEMNALATPPVAATP